VDRLWAVGVQAWRFSPTIHGDRAGTDDQLSDARGDASLAGLRVFDEASTDQRRLLRLQYAKLLLDELLSRLNLGAATWQNDSGLPTTYEIGNTTLSRRNYWKIAHGATLGIGYIHFFDGSGDMQCLRRDASVESGEVFRDSDIIGLRHVRMAEFVNQKSVDLNDAAPVPWSGTAGDSLRWGQATYTKHDKQSQALYGVSADYESEEMVSGWDNIFPYVRDSILWLKYPRHIYELRCAAHPYLDIMDKVRIDSDIQNIHGQMTVIGIDEYISASSYSQTLTLITHRELF